ncbi:MAG: tRNA 2-thiouridine(34) synthase MnmA [Deltaproteobacteria bacterium]|nr:tRNA 2-thiouridine(34) synthase MnmA [Deltaproteobacteria bacterium]MBM4286112.1 tRNA 2-thiouridine(34) synthase MnmA [Deltaproteobacteria bacterium]
MKIKSGKGRIAVALSGGVDSAVAALLLSRQGWEVVGVHLRLGEAAPPCGRLEALGRALGIPVLTLEAREAFARLVLDYFAAAYARGETPNPCVRCNEAVKFGVLWDFVRSQGLEFLATGHYLRRERLPDGEIAVYRGRDRGKDQAYFLQRLPRSLLPHLRFPLGNLTKAEVRRSFADPTLPSLSPCPESQDLCFVREGRYTDFLRTRRRLGVPGDFVDRRGRVLGRHRGVDCYTVGQRRGLGLPAREPYYVLEILPAANQVVVGSREELLAPGLWARQAVWLAAPPTGEWTATAVIRYRHPGVAATVIPAGADRLLVRFAIPQGAVTPGQAVAFFDGDRLLGGAWIEGRL